MSGDPSTRARRGAASAAMIALVVAGIAGSAQQGQESFRPGIDLVPIYVSVIRADGQPVTDLGREDFTVLDTGRPLEIAAVVPPPLPVRLKVLIEDSRGITRHESRVRSMTGGLITGLTPADRIAISTFHFVPAQFSADPEVLSARLSEALAHPRVLQRARDSGSYWAIGASRRDFATSLAALSAPSAGWRDAGYSHWPSGPLAAAKSLVVFSSGLEYFKDADTFSGIFEDMVAATERSLEKTMSETVREGFTVFGVGFNGAGPDKRLKKLSLYSGGRFIEGKMNPEAEGYRIMTELHAQYLLGVVPHGLSGTDRSLEVRVRRPGLTVRAPAFYAVTRVVYHPES